MKQERKRCKQKASDLLGEQLLGIEITDFHAEVVIIFLTT